MITDAPEVGEAGLEAILEGGESRGWTGDAWVTDPALVDGGLQLALLWTCHELGGAALPTSFGASAASRAGSRGGEVKAILTGSERHESRGVSDVVLIDAKGKPVAEILGVEMHVLPGSRAGTSVRV